MRKPDGCIPAGIAAFAMFGAAAGAAAGGGPANADAAAGGAAAGGAAAACGLPQLEQKRAFTSLGAPQDEQAAMVERGYETYLTCNRPCAWRPA